MRNICIGNKISTSRIQVGENLETKINLIVGTNDEEQAGLEKQKIKVAAKLGVNTIIDLSIIRLRQPLWRYGQEHFPDIAFGKVAPILVAVENCGEVSPEYLWKEIKDSVESGVDYMTLNLIPRRLSDLRFAKGRKILTTSRQGGVLLKYMLKHNVDTPYEPILPDILPC